MSAKRSLLVLALLVVLGAGVALGIYAGPTLFPSAKKVPEPTVQPSSAFASASFGRVDLEQGATLLAPLQPGKVVEVLAKENVPVKAGEALIRMDDRGAQAQVESARATVEAAQAQLVLARKAPDRQRVRRLGQQAAIDAVVSRLAAAKEMLAVKQEQRRSNLINQREVTIVEDQIKEIESLKQVEVNRLSELDMNDPVQEIRRAEADLSRSRSQLQLAEEMLAQCTLRAPTNGTVIRLQVSLGEVIGGPGRPQAIVFAAKQPWIVRAEVEQEFVSGVRVGQTVEVQDEVDPRVNFPAKVTRLSSWYLKRRESIEDPTRYSNANVLECIITPDAGHPPLRMGQRVRVLFRGNPLTTGPSNNDQHTSMGTPTRIE